MTDATIPATTPQTIADQVDTLADLLCETAEKIMAEADALEDVAARHKGAANDVP